MLTNKQNILIELKEMKKLAVCDQHIIDKVESGQFDETICELEGMKNSEMCDLIISLASF